MLHLSIGELSDIIDGRLFFGALPPLAGDCEPVRRVVVECQEVAAGDVYWALVRGGYDGSRLADTAFMRGALGVVVAGRHVEPWAGRFSIAVPDTNTALIALAENGSRRSVKQAGRIPRSKTSTEIVQDWLQGHPVDLDAVFDRLPGGPDCVLA